MKFKKTKIIATLGPASSSKEMIKKLIKSGVDVLRVNFSHATHDEVERIVNDVNGLRKELGSNVTLLGDLQGPKIRIGELENDIELKKNHDLKLKLIEELKDLLHSDDDNKSKYERFLSLKKNWVSIGKVPGHLAFGLNNSYDHQVKVFYDFITFFKILV